MVQNPESHCRDLPCRKMHPHKIMHNPVDIQPFLESSCVLCLHMGTPAIGRASASQRRMESFLMIGMNLWGRSRLGRVGMLWIRRLIFRPFGPSPMSL
jgi:hypothetical protein